MSFIAREFHALSRQGDDTDIRHRRAQSSNRKAGPILEESHGPKLGKPPLKSRQADAEIFRIATDVGHEGEIPADLAKKSLVRTHGRGAKLNSATASNSTSARGGGSAGSTESGAHRGGSAPLNTTNDAPTQRRAKSSSIAAVRKADSDIQKSLKEFFHFYIPDHPMRAQTMRSMIRQGTPVVADPIQLLPASIEARRAEVYSKNFDLKEKERRQFQAFIADQNNDPLQSASFDYSDSSSDNSCLQEYDRHKNRSGGRRHKDNKPSDSVKADKHREKQQGFGGV